MLQTSTVTTPFRLYDSMRRQKVAFEPLVPGKVGMYVCGPTTYAPAHIGHAYSAIAFDTVRRSLRVPRLGRHVRPQRHRHRRQDHQARATRRGEDPLAMSRALHRRRTTRDMARFSVRAPDDRAEGHRAHPRDHRDHRAADRERQGLRRRRRRLLRGRRRSRRTASSRARRSTSCEAGARVEVDERKRDPLDFALWKAPSPASRRGTRRGARAGPAGTSSARR